MSSTIEGAKFVYEVQPGERWGVFKNDSGNMIIIVVHPEHELKIVMDDGSIEKVDLFR